MKDAEQFSKNGVFGVYRQVRSGQVNGVWPQRKDNPTSCQKKISRTWKAQIWQSRFQHSTRQQKEWASDEKNKHFHRVQLIIKKENIQQPKFLVVPSVFYIPL